MAINSKIFLNLVNKPNFKLSDLSGQVPNTKVSKDLTYLDIISFHQYIQARKTKLDISNEEIENLSKESGGRFLNSALKFLLKKLNIPEEISPQIRYRNLKNAVNIAGNYETSRVRININEPPKNYDKRLLLMTILHELEHWKQMIDGLRCDLTSEFVMQKNAFSLLLWKNKINKVDESNYDFVKNMLDNRMQNPIFLRYYKKQQQYQRKVVKYMGKIDDNSPEAKNCLRYAEEVNNFDKVTANKINYMCSYMEYLPYIREFALGERLFYPNKCMLKRFKSINKYSLDNLVKQETENQGNYSQNFKDLLNSQPNPIISFFG